MVTDPLDPDDVVAARFGDEVLQAESDALHAVLVDADVRRRRRSKAGTLLEEVRSGQMREEERLGEPVRRDPLAQTEAVVDAS